jgi:hypothetical protein
VKIWIDTLSAERECKGNCTYIRGILEGISKIDVLHVQCVGFQKEK